MSTNEQTIILSPSPDDEIVVILSNDQEGQLISLTPLPTDEDIIVVLSIEHEKQVVMHPVGEKGDKGEKGDAGMTPEEITNYIDSSLINKFFDVFDEQLFT